MTHNPPSRFEEIVIAAEDGSFFSQRADAPLPEGCRAATDEESAAYRAWLDSHDEYSI